MRVEELAFSRSSVRMFVFCRIALLLISLNWCMGKNNEDDCKCILKLKYCNGNSWRLDFSRCKALCRVQTKDCLSIDYTIPYISCSGSSTFKYCDSSDEKKIAINCAVKCTDAPLPDSDTTPFLAPGRENKSSPLQGNDSMSSPLPGRENKSSLLQGNDSMSSPLPGRENKSSPLQACETETIVLRIALVIVIIVSAVVISMLLWRMRTLTGTCRCNKWNCLPFCHIRDADDKSLRTPAIELENQEHVYTSLQQQAGTSETLPTPLERAYSLARNFSEEVSNADSEYSLANQIPAGSEKQEETSVVYSLAKHPDATSGGATPEYFILEKESDVTRACKEAESNQEYVILEKDSDPFSDED